MHRLYSLDYLRGLAALTILAYHYHLWETPNYTPQADSFLDRMGLYGVSIFYVLSGFTLARVYALVDWHKKDVWITFLKKRLFRILPLLILVSGLSAVVSGRPYTVWQWFLNVTGLFGYLDRDAYIATGAWSIGNELVFYGLFPFFMVLARSRWSHHAVLIGCIFWVTLPFFYLNEHSSLPSQWNAYIHPLYQALFFVGGVILSFFSKPHGMLRWGSVLLGIGILGYFPVSGGHIALVVQVPKIALGSACLLLVFGISSLPAFEWKPAHWVLKTLGEWSYGIYLWHPLVYIVISWLERKQGVDWGYVKWSVFLGIVVFVSGLSYHGFEKRWVRWSK